ncbi:MAG TPA: metalloregulator ArsR/SmtB family transcription factor [Bacillota bacterium]|nr:metalloregulator ArsR/SmtB family transcription factor [Bacillota bacterium]
MELTASEICKVLAVETRLQIIKLLKTKGPHGAKAIAEALGMTPAAISQHLKILSQVGLVHSERNGFFIPYSVDDGVLNQCRKLFSEACLCGCDGKNLLEPNFNTADLETLLQYEKDLEQRLGQVRRRMKELANQEVSIELREGSDALQGRG